MIYANKHKKLIQKFLKNSIQVSKLIHIRKYQHSKHKLMNVLKL
jgi:hypothetical protein